MKHKRFLFVLLTAALLLAATGSLVRQTQQTARNLALCEAVKHSQWNKALAALHAGADPNFRLLPSRSFWKQLQALWQPRLRLRDSDAPSAYWLAADAGAPPSFLRTMVLAGADMRSRSGRQLSSTREGQTPLHCAVDPGSRSYTLSEEDDALVAAMLAHGADVNARDQDGMTPLLSAVTGRASVFKMLLEQGADPNARDPNGMSVLQWAFIFDASLSLSANTHLLLEYGADPNIGDRYGVPMLLYALTLRRLDFARLLLEHGADANITDADGNTALFYAHSPEATRLLLQFGANPAHRNHKGQTVHTAPNAAFNNMNVLTANINQAGFP